MEASTSRRSDARMPGFVRDWPEHRVPKGAADPSAGLVAALRPWRAEFDLELMTGGVAAGPDVPPPPDEPVTVLLDGLPTAVFGVTPDSLVLRVAPDSPLRPVAEIVLSRVAHTGQDALTPAERFRLREHAGRPVDPRVSDVSGVVREHALRAPDAVAVRQGGRELTYAELTARAAAVAGALRRSGVCRGDVVVVGVPRSPELVVALLGVLTAGAAYCVLAPDWPPSRVRDVLLDTGATTIVTDGQDWVDVDAHRVDLTALHDPLLVPDPTQADLDAPFCVYYTSGSTGSPKAVLSTHRAILRTLEDPDHPRVTDRPAMLSAAALPWDAFSLELWFPLLHGGVTHQIEEEQVTPGALRDAVARGVEVVWLTSSLFNLVVDEDPGTFTGLREVLTGGERLSPVHVRRFLSWHPDITLVNGYGPVETSVFATTHVIGPADCDRPGGIPVGSALPGTEIVVLGRDATGRLVPAPYGEIGEIAVAGDGLATGYIGRAAAQTRDRFPIIELAGGRSARVYLTGDLGRWTAAGVLEFRGRGDRQVKIRGHRVEPGEVEAAVLADPGVSRCVVVPRDDGRGTFLAAYVVGSADLDPDLVRERLTRTLPPYLVPAHVVRLAELPLGPTGKVAVAALPAPPSPGPAATPVREVGGVVGAVCRQAGEVLGLPVGPDDDLRALGMDSLAATRIAHRLLVEEDVRIRVGDVVRLAVPAAMAEVAISGPAAAEQVEAGPVLTDRQVTLWLDDLMRPDRRQANVVVRGYRFSGPVDGLPEALADVVARHDALRTAIAEDDDGGPVGHSLEVDEALHVESLAGDDVVGDAAELAEAVDLANGPLVAAGVRAHPDGSTTLLLAVHHACFDGHSEGLLAADLSDLLAGRPLTTAPSHGAFAAAERRAPTPAPEPDWARRLARTRPLDWPVRPEAGAGDCATTTFTIPQDTGRRLDVAARALRVTPFLLGLGAFGRALRAVTGTASFGIGVPTAGRDDATHHGVVGFLVRTLVVPFDEQTLPEQTFPVQDVVGGLAEAWHTAQRHADTPLPELARHAERSAPDRSPLFQAQFAWQNFTPPRWSIPDVEVRQTPIPPLRAQFEVTLEVWPAPDGTLRVQLDHDPSHVTDGVARELHAHFALELDRIGRP